ncbi:MAG: hypothetical protein A2Y56_13100 [Candidatus Aminicenantes bacterium RBG_13_63_10]|nr:MAG: hypothetical protein A2Y56_13100 [Candidatus Aminicenantes bacterium RBG_13_63_10]
MKSGKSPVLFLLSFLAASAACSRNTAYVRVRLEVPTAPAVKVADYREIAVAGFCLPEPSTDVDLDQDLSAFFEAELKIRSGAAVSRRRLTLDDEALLGQEDFWKMANGAENKTLFLTGKARFEQELRKALLEKGGRRGEDPFRKDKVWEERKAFTLEASLMLIDGTTGRPVFERDYKEVATYSNIRQPASFALFDILQRLKVKFFRAVLGTERTQERYLLIK